MLVLLYYLSQNPDFSASVKPIMEKLKGSEEMLRFLKDLSQFSQTFSTFASGTMNKENAPPSDKKPEKSPESKKEPQSPTTSIADEFIQTVLENYLNNRKT